VALVLFPPFVLVTTGVQGSLKWVDNFGIQILIYVMLAWGLNIVVGLAGLLDLGYVAFYAVGAYSYTLLAINFDLSFWILLPIAGILAALWGVLLGFPVLRLRGDYLAIVTLAFGEIVRLVLVNWREVTKGGFGITSIPKVTFFGIKFDASPEGFAHTFGLPLSSAYYKIFLFYLILGLALLTAWSAFGCVACPSAAHGNPSAKMKSPAALSGSIPPRPSSPPLPLARCSPVSPARSSPRGKASSAPNPSPSLSPP